MGVRELFKKHVSTHDLACAYSRNFNDRDVLMIGEHHNDTDRLRLVEELRSFSDAYRKETSRIIVFLLECTRLMTDLMRHQPDFIIPTMNKGRYSKHRLHLMSDFDTECVDLRNLFTNSDPENMQLMLDELGTPSAVQRFYCVTDRIHDTQHDENSILALVEMFLSLLLGDDLDFDAFLSSSLVSFFSSLCVSMKTIIAYAMGDVRFYKNERVLKVLRSDPFFEAWKRDVSVLIEIFLEGVPDNFQVEHIHECVCNFNDILIAMKILDLVFSGRSVLVWYGGYHIENINKILGRAERKLQ